jgi:hypothetical protein
MSKAIINYLELFSVLMQSKTKFVIIYKSNIQAISIFQMATI